MVPKLAWPATVAFCAWCLAGAATSLEVTLPQVTEIVEAIGSWFTWALGVALIGSLTANGVLILVLNSRTAKMGQQIRELQTGVDPKRLSSGLELDGTTGRGDR